MSRPLIVDISKRPSVNDHFRPIPAGRSQQSFTQRTFRGFFPIDSIPQPMLFDCEAESRQANEVTDNDFYRKSCESFPRGIRQR